MASQLNTYLNPNITSEQNLVEDLQIEAIQAKGITVFYLKRTAQNLDTIFGEDTSVLFSDAIEIEMYFDKPDGFDNTSMIDKFGGFFPKEATFTVSRKRFQQECGVGSSVDIRPLEGALLYLPLTKEFFEIKYVTPEKNFYQLGKNYLWVLTVEKYVYSQGETIDTGVSIVDAEIAGIQANENEISVLDFTANNDIIETDRAVDKTEVDPFSLGNY